MENKIVEKFTEKQSLNHILIIILIMIIVLFGYYSTKQIYLVSNEAYYNLEKYILNPILEKYEIPKFKRKYILKFYINDSMGIVKQWTMNNCQDKIEDIMNIIIECINLK